MDVIYDVITEDVLRQFDADDYGMLAPLLDDTVARCIRLYLENPNGDPAVQSECNKYLGQIVRSYTFHMDVVEKDIITLVREIQPETILSNSTAYLQDVKQKLQYLRDNTQNLRTSIPARKRADWESFYAHIADKPFATPSFMQRLSINKSIFYSAREQDRLLPTKYLLSAKHKWDMALNAILWDEQCKKTGNTVYSTTGRLRFF